MSGSLISMIKPSFNEKNLESCPSQAILEDLMT